MELDVRLNDRSVAITGRIADLVAEQGLSMNGLDVGGLVALMVRGVAGCEAGCPADAKGLVERGHLNFRLEYIEGGILAARAEMTGGGTLELKLFPDF